MNSNLIRLKRLFLMASTLAVAALSQAQLQTPAASPHAVLKQTVGLTEVEVEYSRPSVKDREIFGELVPYGEIWRTGANQATKLTFSDDVTLGGENIPAGSYALYTIPGKKEWTLIIYSSTELWGAFGHDPSKDVARIKVKPQALKQPVESLTIGFDHLRNDGARLFLAWDKTQVATELEVPTDDKVMSQIEKLKDTPEFENPNALFAAGTYYHESGKDLEQALEWVNAATEKSDNAPYWMFARKARIEVDLGKKEAAKASAEKTLELATEAGNPDYQKIAKDILASL